MVAKVHASLVARRWLAKEKPERYRELLEIEKAKFVFPRYRDDRLVYTRLMSKAQSRAQNILKQEFPEDYNRLKTEAVNRGYSRGASYQN
jgi:hypothetical protein